MDYIGVARALFPKFLTFSHFIGADDDHITPNESARPNLMGARYTQTTNFSILFILTLSYVWLVGLE